ncbi:MAG: tRNA glutamyl-Q(34) synthetase GluQRS [Hyphomicrobiaceae bacterium]
MTNRNRAVFRFAPSPNGELHLGHAFSALIGHDWAKRVGGRFLVRIEDIDKARSRDDFVESILDDLAWLGISWEKPVLRQSQHFADYAAAAQKLEKMGLLYPCLATRSEIAMAIAAAASAGKTEQLDPDGVPLYPGLYRGIDRAELDTRRAAGEPSALRLDIEKALTVAAEKLGGRPLTFRQIDEDGSERIVPANPDRWGDAVLIRKDTPASYHLSVVVDDARQGITHVTRGADLYAATDLHRLLQVLLDLPQPIYHHHRLLYGPDGRKLAKSTGAPRLKQLRSQGVARAQIREQLGLPAEN